jgi:hypothetical protein
MTVRRRTGVRFQAARLPVSVPQTTLVLADAMAGQNADLVRKQAADDRSLDKRYPITAEQIKSLHEKSWAPLPGFLDKDTVAEIRDLLLAIPDRGFLSGPDSPYIDSLMLMLHDGTSFRDPEMMKFITAPRIAGAVVELLKVPEAVTER